MPNRNNPLDQHLAPPRPGSPFRVQLGDIIVDSSEPNDQDGPEQPSTAELTSRAVQLARSRFICESCRQESPLPSAPDPLDEWISRQVGVRPSTVIPVNAPPAPTTRSTRPHLPDPDQEVLKLILRQTHVARSLRWNLGWNNAPSEDPIYRGKSPQAKALQAKILYGKFSSIANEESIVDALRFFYPDTKFFAHPESPNASQTFHPFGATLRLPLTFFVTCRYSQVIALSLGDGYFIRWRGTRRSQGWECSVNVPNNQLTHFAIPQKQTIKRFLTALPNEAKPHLRSTFG